MVHDFAETFKLVNFILLGNCCLYITIHTDAGPRSVTTGRYLVLMPLLADKLVLNMSNVTVTMICCYSIFNRINFKRLTLVHSPIKSDGEYAG